MRVSAAVKKISKSAVRRVAHERRDGYVEAVFSAASQSDDTHVWLTDEAYASLRAQYAAGPSLLNKARNFATSAAKHVAAGMPQASDDEVARRFAICQACEHFDGKACRQCGCPIVREKRFVSKLSWANERCPVGKWGPAT